MNILDLSSPGHSRYRLAGVGKAHGGLGFYRPENHWAAWHL
jgi:hypothetical protein